MNFIKQRDFTKPRVMQNGDLVIVYERHDSLDHFYLAENTIFNNKYGTFYHNDMIGKPFGSKINSTSSPGYVYLLEPTPELWSNAVHTRTQIVNELDSSVVTLNLDVAPGSVVVETGTGSGCMTLSLARAVHPSGHVFTFEYNGVRAQKAREEFDKLGVGHLVTVTHKDVCGKTETSDATEASTSSTSTVPIASTLSTPSTAPVSTGPNTASSRGGFPNVADATADAVFLDLPEPWLAMDHVLRVLKPGKTMCSYSPCIEQVMKTCEKMRELKFHSIRMMEVRQRPYDARVIEMETLDLGLSPEGEAINNRSARDRSNTHQKTKPRQNFNPVFVARTAGDNTDGAVDGVEGDAGDGADGKMEGVDERNEGEGACGAEDKQEDECDDEGGADGKDGGAAGDRTNKRRRITFKNGADGAEDVAAVADDKKEVDRDGLLQVYEQGSMTDAQFQTLQNRIKNRPVSSVNGSYEMHIARPLGSMKGHTAFLTFAVCPLRK